MGKMLGINVAEHVAKEFNLSVSEIEKVYESTAKAVINELNKVKDDEHPLPVCLPGLMVFTVTAVEDSVCERHIMYAVNSHMHHDIILGVQTDEYIEMVKEKRKKEIVKLVKEIVNEHSKKSVKNKKGE
jgi:hypothetical protein